MAFVAEFGGVLQESPCRVEAPWASAWRPSGRPVTVEPSSGQSVVKNAFSVLAAGYSRTLVGFKSINGDPSHSSAAAIDCSDRDVGS